MIGDDNTCKDGSEVRPMGFVGVLRLSVKLSCESLTRVLRESYDCLTITSRFPSVRFRVIS